MVAAALKDLSVMGFVAESMQEVAQ